MRLERQAGTGSCGGHAGHSKELILLIKHEYLLSVTKVITVTLYLQPSGSQTQVMLGNSKSKM